MTELVEVDLTADGRGTVRVNGVEVPRVQAVRVSGAAGRGPRVLLVLVPDRILVRSQGAAPYVVGELGPELFGGLRGD
jgi:hypothetical protein